MTEPKGYVDRCISDYLGDVFDPEEASEKAEGLVKSLKRSRVKFDAIACRGVSGLLVAPLVARLTGKPLIVVRKDETTHSSSKVEGFDRLGHRIGANEPKFRYIILDDFIDSGSTIAAIIEAMTEYRSNAVLAGIACYKAGYNSVKGLRPDSSNKKSGLTKVPLVGIATYRKKDGDIPVYTIERKDS